MSTLVRPPQHSTCLTDPTPLVEWLGLRIALPRPWEIVRHGVSGRKGSLAFADRRRQRLQVTWTTCVKRPDVARLLSDHRDRQKALDPDAVFVTPTLPAGWRGLERRLAVTGADADEDAVDHEHRAVLVRAARYDDATDRLIEVVVDQDPSDPSDVSLAAEVLAGLRVVSKPEEARRLRAFGIDADLPAGWRLHRAAVRPADTTLVFVPSDKPVKADASGVLRRSVTLRRRALADVWFDGDWEALFRRDEPKAAVDLGVGIHDDIEIVDAAWDVPGPRYERLMRRHAVATARAWCCPEAGAVYQATAIGPAKTPPTLEGFTLAGRDLGEGRCPVE